MNASISAASLEYVKAKVRVVKNGALYDPTSDLVTMAFTATEDLPAKDVVWSEASWETVDGEHYARCLVGPDGDAELIAGVYYVWVTVVDDPEVPVKPAGILLVR